MAAAAENNDRHFLGLTEEEERFAKNLAAKALVSTATYPLVCCKTLIQLGHEPFPLSTGKTLIVAGRNAYFLPNLFSYGNQMRLRDGWKALFTGVEAGVGSLLVQGLTTNAVTKYLDNYYPEVGGKAENEDAEERDLTDHESFRRKLRQFIRDSVVRSVAITVARPLTVVMVRQVAQLIGREVKYTNLFQALRLVGVEEGPAGLFSGLVPQIIGEVTVIFGIHALSFLCERAIFHIGMYENQDERSVKEVKDVRQFVGLAVPFVVQSYGYPYSVVSTIMAVAGSGLAVSFLPFSPSFLNWQNAYDYLRPHGLKRGARMFLREQTGAVSVGSDQQLYASNKYFA